jgi:asparagine synthase (glutamine-hydrolysing)
MCGISAFLCHPGKASSNEQANAQTRHVVDELEHSLDLVGHRGPDARGRWFSDDHKVGRSHRSLLLRGRA